MNKFQAEKKDYVFRAVLRVDVKQFQNPTGRSPFDQFLDPQSMPRLFKTLNRWLIQTLLLLILFQKSTTGVRLHSDFFPQSAMGHNLKTYLSDPHF